VGRDRPATSDAELVGQALGGNSGALAELLRRHWDTAVLLCARVLGSTELARDAAQEAAIAAMTDLERLRSADRFGAWFCGIALNVARRWLRQLRSEVPGMSPDLAAQSPGPQEAAEFADMAARVRRAIATLPNGQKDAVLLYYLQGLNHREVAAELGISPGAVKARLHQARAALAPRLAQYAGPRPVGAGRPAARPAISTEVESMTKPDAARWTQVQAREIRASHHEGADSWQRTYVMMLAERDGDRQLPIWIGPAEAMAMAMALEASETPRPFTYKLAAGLVQAADAEVAEVRITRLLDGVFYALVIVRGPAGTQEVDARPSDAVNLALATGAPIMVDNALFDREVVAEYAEKLAASEVATAQIAEEATQAMAAIRHCRPESGEAPEAPTAHA
jgi:RNA polymerase sigma factor (sigma-70 family)